MFNSNNLIDSFKQLIVKIKTEITKNINNKTIKPVEEIHDYWKIDTFEYNNENGNIHYSSRLEKKTRKNWAEALVKIYELIKESSEYINLIQLIENISPEKNIDYIISNLISNFLENQDLSDSEIEKAITTFVKYIKNDPIKIGVKVELKGIVIVPKSIELKTEDKDIILRQPIVEDLEKHVQPVQPTFPMVRPVFQRPSAILNFELLGRGQVDVLIAINKAINILQLFKVGGVFYSLYNMYSESLISPMELEGSYWQIAMSYEKSLITNEDVPKLERFWDIMEKNLPQSFYELQESTIDYLTIAYKRYCDALLQSSEFERKILNAVMGLEAIFLKEDQELKYRLSIRIAKVFGHLGYNASDVKEHIRIAYGIRSTFVHGQILTNKQKSKFNDINKFVTSILDYLRISIIAMICIQMQKEELLVILDSALIDKEADDKLEKSLSSTKELLS